MEARGNCTCNFPLAVPARRGCAWSTVLGPLACASPCEAVLCTGGPPSFPHTQCTHAPTPTLPHSRWIMDPGPGLSTACLLFCLISSVCHSRLPPNRPLAPPPSRQTPRSSLYPHRLLLTSRAVSRSLHHPRTSLAKSILYPVVRNQCLTYILYYRPRARARSHPRSHARSRSLSIRAPRRLLYKVRPVCHPLAALALAVRSFVFWKIESAIAGRHHRPSNIWDNRQPFPYIHLDGNTFARTIARGQDSPLAPESRDQTLTTHRHHPPIPAPSGYTRTVVTVDSLAIHRIHEPSPCS